MNTSTIKSVIPALAIVIATLTTNAEAGPQGRGNRQGQQAASQGQRHAVAAKAGARQSKQQGQVRQGQSRQPQQSQAASQSRPRQMQSQGSRGTSKSTACQQQNFRNQIMGQLQSQIEGIARQSLQYRAQSANRSAAGFSGWLR